MGVADGRGSSVGRTGSLAPFQHEAEPADPVCSKRSKPRQVFFEVEKAKECEFFAEAVWKNLFCKK